MFVDSENEKTGQGGCSHLVMVPENTINHFLHSTKYQIECTYIVHPMHLPQMPFQNEVECQTQFHLLSFLTKLSGKFATGCNLLVFIVTLNSI